jgi:menaquinone-dependent protoporphyrinogen IX oxidase
MAKISIIYQGKYGTTRQYAEWIAEDTGASLFETKRVKLKDIIDSDVVVFGGGLYATGIMGIKFLERHYSSLKGKRIIVFSVGASAGTEKDRATVQAVNLCPEMWERVKYFHLRGALNYPAMNAWDKFLMGLLITTLKIKPEGKRDEETRAMIATYGKNTSFMDRRSLEPLLAAIKG